MLTIGSWEEAQDRAAKEPWALFYLSLPGCGVCTALKPKVGAMADDVGIPVYYVDLGEIPEAGGQWSMFTIPGILLFFAGREVWRGARFIDTRELSDVLERYRGFLSLEGP